MLKITSLRFFAVILLLSSTFTSCKKGGNDDTGAGSDNHLIIAFSGATVPINAVDSVITIFTNGSDTIRVKGVGQGAFYSVPYSSLKAGSYTALTKVYTALNGVDSAGLRYMFRYQTSVNTTSNGNLVAPTHNAYDLWKASLYFYDIKYKIGFAVAQKPTDPYFELNLPAGLNYKNLYIARNIYKTVSNVKYPVGFANAIFKVAGYLGFHANSTSFAGFATSAANVTYDSADVTLELYNDDSSSYWIVFQKGFSVSN